MQTKQERWNQTQKYKSKFVPHRFVGKLCGYTYCTQCGLLLMNNKASKKAQAKLCDVGED